MLTNLKYQSDSAQLKKNKTPKFIKKLINDINDYKKITQNVDNFIKYKNIKIYKFKKNIKKLDNNDLPIDTVFGSLYLVKGSNILEIYSWYDIDRSAYLQISLKKPMCISKIFIINKEVNDPENLEFILDGCKTCYGQSEIQYLILQFLQTGFIMYVKK